MYDFDYDNNTDKVDEWKTRLENAGANPDDIYNYVGATYNEIEGVVQGVERRKAK